MSGAVNTRMRQTLAGSRPTSRAIGLPLLVFLIACVAFWPAMSNGFVNLDDTSNFRLNYNYRGLGPANIRWAFTTFHFGAWQPLSWILLSAQYVLWGLDPKGYHAVGVLVHGANAVLFYRVALRLLTLAVPVLATRCPTGAGYSAGLAALLFAVHPLRTEAVAWVSCQPYVWVGFFYLLSILAYLRMAQEGRTAARRVMWLSLSWLCCGLSLLSKGVGVGLAGVLLLLDIYPLRRLWPGRARGQDGPSVGVLLAEKVPFFLLAGGSVLMAMRSKAAAMVPTTGYDLPHRLVQAAWGAVFYLEKTLLPIGLSPWYQSPPGFSFREPQFILRSVLVVGLTVAALALVKYWPAGSVLWAYYWVMLAPVSHVSRLGWQVAADRYTYLSCMGWAVLGGYGLLKVWNLHALGRLRRSSFVGIVATAATACALLMMLSWRQISFWRDDVALWSRAIDVSPKLAMPHGNLGVILRLRNNPAGSLPHLAKAVECDPNLAVARSNLALTLLDLGRYAQVIEQCRALLAIEPHSADAYCLWGMALAGQGDLDGAAARYRMSLGTDPNYAPARIALARLLEKQGKLDQSIALLLAGTKLPTPDPKVLSVLARTLLGSSKQRSPSDALRWAEQASRLAHDENPEILETLAAALAANGRAGEAVSVCMKALGLARQAGQADTAGRLSRSLEGYRRQAQPAR